VRKAGFFIAAPLLFSASAFAADIPLKAPPKAELDGWAGPYIGGYFAAVGGGRVRETADEAVLQTNSTRLSSADFSGRATGTMVDLFTGRNWRFGNFVVGGQVEATVASDIDLMATGPLLANQSRTNAGVVISASTSSTMSGNDPQLKFRAGLIGRAGFLARPDLLLYGLAGLEFGHFSFPDTDDQFGSANRNWAIGYTAGAGVEARIDDHWSLRGEYRYLHFATSRSEALVLTGSTLTTVRHSDIGIQVGKVGLVYRFGESGSYASVAAMAPASRKVWADSWAGPYAGIYFGAGAGNVAETYSYAANSVPAIGPSTTKIGQFSGNMTGSMNDAFLGYNWRADRLVAGVQAEGTVFSDVRWKATGTQTSVNIGNTQVGPGNDFQQLRSTVGLIGRAGFLATPDLLLYGLAGAEFGHFVYPNGRDAIGGENGKWVAGYTAGAGGELRINDHWSLRGEYRYLHFDVNRSESMPSGSVNVFTGATTAFTANTSRPATADFQVGKIGVVYKFGDAGPASAMAAIPPSVVSASVISAWTDGWAGPYVGVYFGAGAGTAHGSYAGRSVDDSGVGSFSSAALAGNMSGTQADLFAGYNVRSARLVFGGQIEATQFSDVAAKTTGISTTILPGSNESQSSTFDHPERLRSMIAVVGRAGFLATPNLLLYGLGGVALGHFTYPDTGSFSADPDGKWVTGYTVGGGGEMKIAGHWSLRAEYRYLHFDIDRDANYASAITQPPNPPTSLNNSLAIRTSTDFHLGKIGLAYRFGDDPASAMAAMSAGCCERWTGFVAGLYGAGGMGRVRDVPTSANDISTLNIVSSPAVITSASSNFKSGTLSGDTKAGMIDLFAGYNRRAGNFVVGGQIEATVYADAEMKSRGVSQTISTQTVPPSAPVAGTEASQFQQTLRSRAGLIGRAGFLATPDLLLYGLAGAEFGHFAFLDAIDLIGGEDGKWAFGYTAGAGAELKLTERWSLRGEYRYMRFDLDRTATNISNQANSNFINSNSFIAAARTRADFNLGKVGIAYNFCYCD
jgi:opacity protein-like surface antigen